MSCQLAAVLFLCCCQVHIVGAQTVTLSPSSEVEVDEHDQVLFTCLPSGFSSTILTVRWLKNSLEEVTLKPNDCSELSGTVNSTLYEADCTNTFSWKILDVTESQDGDEWSCSLNDGVVYSSGTGKLSVQVCPSILGLVSSSQVNTTDRSPNTVVFVNCTTSVADSLVTTCQPGGTWDPLPQNGLSCGTTTTTSTSTTTTTVPTTTTTTTTTTIPTTTTSTSTTPTGTSPSTTTTAVSTTSATTSTTATTTSTTSTGTTKAPSTTQAPVSATSTITVGPSDSNKGLITMIIVVSVIGGILIIAIVFMVFLMVYWNDCLGLRSYGKHAHHKSYRHDKHHHHGHHKKYKARREPSDLNSYQMQNPLEGYAFYKGVRNPVFDEGAELSDSLAVYYRDTGDMVYAPQYGNPPPRYSYASNWEILD